MAKEDKEREVRKKNSRIEDLKKIISFLEWDDRDTQGKLNASFELSDSLSKDDGSVRKLYEEVWRPIEQLKASFNNIACSLSDKDKSDFLQMTIASVRELIIKEMKFINDNSIQHPVLLSSTPNTQVANDNSTLKNKILKDYEKLINDRITAELVDIKIINKADAYYAARKLSIVGELITQLRDAGVDSPVGDDIKWTGIRGKLVHNFPKIIAEIETDKKKLNEFAGLYKALIDAFNAKQAAITNPSSSVQSSNASLPINDTLLKLEQFLDQVGTDAARSLVTPAAQIEKVGNDLVKIHKLLKTANAKFNGNGPKTIETLNEEYKAAIAEPQVVALLDGYPKEISDTTHAEIAKICANLDQATKDKESAEKKAREQQLLRDNEEKVKKTFELIKIESEFLASIRNDAQIDPRIKLYIIDHIAAIIGDNLTLIRDNPQFKEFRDQNLTSNTFEGAKIKNIRARKKVAHNVLSPDRDFVDEALGALDAAELDVMSISYILKNKSRKDSVAIVNNLAASYCRLTHYKESTLLFEEALKILQDKPDDVAQEKQTSLMGSQMPADATFVDFDKEMFGVDSYELTIVENLSHLYFVTAEYKKSIDLLKSFLDKIVFNHPRVSSSDFKDVIASLYNDLAICYYHTGDKEKAIQATGNALELSSSDETKYAIIHSRLLLDCDISSEDIENLKDQLQHYSNASLATKIDFTLNQALKSQRLVDGKKYITEATRIYNDNEQALREKYGDRAILERLKILRFEAKLHLDHKDHLKPDDVIRIWNELNEIKKIENFNQKFLDDNALINMYEMLINLVIKITLPPKKHSDSTNKNLIDIATASFESIKDLSSEENKRQLAQDLLSICGNITLSSGEVSYLENALGLKSYGVKLATTYNNIGLLYYNQSFNENDANTYIELFQKSQNYYNLAYNQAIQEHNTRIKFEALNGLAINFEHYYSKTGDKDSLRDAIQTSKEFLKLATKEGNQVPDQEILKDMQAIYSECSQILQNITTAQPSSVRALPGEGNSQSTSHARTLSAERSANNSISSKGGAIL